MSKSKGLSSPDRRQREAFADRCIHWIGVVAGAAAVIALIRDVEGRGVMLLVSVLVYGAGLLAMLVCSAMYHLCRTTRRKALLQRVDHAAIFVMIAGSYTPVTLSEAGGPWGFALLAFIWSVAGFGIALKLLWPRSLHGISIVAYLLLGWSAVFILDGMASTLSPNTLALLVAGGVLYTVGVVFHVWRRLPYQTAIWHAFVLAATSCHYVAIASGVVPLIGS
jgi:hemolysin III